MFLRMLVLATCVLTWLSFGFCAPTSLNETAKVELLGARSSVSFILHAQRGWGPVHRALGSARLLQIAAVVPPLRQRQQQSELQYNPRPSEQLDGLSSMQIQYVFHNIVYEVTSTQEGIWTGLDQQSRPIGASSVKDTNFIDFDQLLSLEGAVQKAEEYGFHGTLVGVVVKAAGPGDEPYVPGEILYCLSIMSTGVLDITTNIVIGGRSGKIRVAGFGPSKDSY